MTTCPTLVVVDVQKAIDDPKWGPRNNPDAENVIAQLLTAWRNAAAPIFHVRHDSTIPGSTYRPGQSGNDFKPEVAPIGGEPIIVKQTNSAFIGTGFEWRLRREGHHKLLIVGVITNNSLEATVRNAGNLGFEVFVVGDACWTVDKVDLNGRRWLAEDVHALSLANMNGLYATIVDLETAISWAK